LLFVSLGLDTLAVALGLGLSSLPRQRWLAVGLTFAFFEGLMPVVGLVIGAHLVRAAGELAGYLAAILLLVVGGLAIKEALSDDEEDEEKPPPQGHRLALMGLSVSLDELAVGFSLGVLKLPLVAALGYIGVQAFGLTFIGLALGRRLGARLGDWAELASGIVLTLLGIAFLISQATTTMPSR
jgi:putative Mn2+ efflux pump MntP